MKKILIIFIFLLYGCGNPTPKFLPKSEVLPDAVINEPYQASITITGGALNEKSVWVKIHPIGSGLTWNPKESSFQWEGKEEIRKDYLHINITGIPKKTELIKIEVVGFTLGTMYPGKDFDKTYTIKVKNK
ncbi:hypothetical protein [Xenorhabdus kozodoii]|uniref:Lipoprotein n=1 Tax=Xenorhabdus kozodoii TaxID=351676 RepID=A0A2D0LD34_9GAMM|nr:hypothetical protein [Xenorhabdus kozodoii]PHM73572.1 hypothetical protein Xkoz_01713 [Xenorhabdus kozodoii]